MPQSLPHPANYRRREAAPKLSSIIARGAVAAVLPRVHACKRSFAKMDGAESARNAHFESANAER